MAACSAAADCAADDRRRARSRCASLASALHLLQLGVERVELRPAPRAACARPAGRRPATAARRRRRRPRAIAARRVARRQAHASAAAQRALRRATRRWTRRAWSCVSLTKPWRARRRLSATRPSAPSTAQPARRSCVAELLDLLGRPARRRQRQPAGLEAQRCRRRRCRRARPTAAACSRVSRSLSPARPAAARSTSVSRCICTGASSTARTCGKVSRSSVHHLRAPTSTWRCAGARPRRSGRRSCSSSERGQAEAHRPPGGAEQAAPARRAARACRGAAAPGRTGAGSTASAPPAAHARPSDSTSTRRTEPAFGRRRDGRRGAPARLRAPAICGSSARASDAVQAQRWPRRWRRPGQHDARGRSPRRPRRSGPRGVSSGQRGHHALDATPAPFRAPPARRAARACAPPRPRPAGPPCVPGASARCSGLARRATLLRAAPPSAARRRAAGAFGSVMRCQLTSLSASTATTLSAAAAAPPARGLALPTCRPSGLST